MRKFVLLLLFLLLLIICFFTINGKESFVFVHTGTSEVAAYLPVESKKFQIKYTHSIHLSDVVESYEVKPDGSLLLTQLEYEDFAIGMPSNAGEGEVFVEENGKYRIENMNRELPSFRLLVGDVDAGLAFLTDGQEYNLKKFLNRGETYIFRVQKLSLYEQVKGVKMHE